jgi:hypothetical protein
MTDDQADIGLSELRDEYVYDGASLLVISGCLTRPLGCTEGLVRRGACRPLHPRDKGLVNIDVWLNLNE